MLTSIKPSDVADAFLIIKDNKTFKEEIVLSVALDTIKNLCVKCGFDLREIERLYQEKKGNAFDAIKSSSALFRGNKGFLMILKRHRSQ